MVSTSSERQRKRRAKLKASGKYGEYRKKETEYHKRWEAGKKVRMTTEQKMQLREIECLRKRQYRAKLR
jgi:hypothetical protein